MQLKLFEPGDFLTIREASDWASQYLGKNIANSNSEIFSLKTI